MILGGSICRDSGGGLAIDFLAVPDAEDEHQKTVVFDLADEAKGADAVSPELAEARALQGLANVAGIVQPGDALLQEFHNTFGVLRIELAEFTVGFDGKLNPPGHDVLRRLRAE
jgi:hypothetical protein